jgi:bifunctional DNA-binding transcriptional regulator/antitoxin component of YhaV-PrlF toxin-antitoxin module
MRFTKLGVSRLELKEKDRLVTEIPWLAATTLNLKEGDRLVWYLGRGGFRVMVVRAGEAVPEGDDIVDFLG